MSELPESAGIVRDIVPFQSEAEPRAREHQQALLIITAPDVTRQDAEKLKSRVFSDIRRGYPDLENEQIEYFWESITNSDAEGLTVEDFLTMDEGVRKIIADNLLGPTPVIMIPHEINGRKGIVPAGLTKPHNPDNPDKTRGVGVVFHVEDGRFIASVAEGRVGVLGKFGNRKLRAGFANEMAWTNLEEGMVWFTPAEQARALAEKADEYSAKVRKQNEDRPDKKIPEVTVRAEDIEMALRAALAIPGKRDLPSHEEILAREGLVRIINTTISSTPVSEVAELAVRGTEYEDDLDLDALHEIDNDPAVQKAREDAKLSWRDLLVLLPDDMRVALYRRVEIVFRAYEFIEAQRQGVADMAAEALVRDEMRRLGRTEKQLQLAEENAKKADKKARKLDEKAARAWWIATEKQLEADHAGRMLMAETQKRLAIAQKNGIQRKHKELPALVQQYEDDVYEWMGIAREQLAHIIGGALGQQIQQKLAHARQLTHENSQLMFPDFTDAEEEAVQTAIVQHNAKPFPQMPEAMTIIIEKEESNDS